MFIRVCARYRGNVVTKCEIYDPEARSDNLNRDLNTVVAPMLQGDGGGAVLKIFTTLRIIKTIFINICHLFSSSLSYYT
jgi:hypothetical protein